MEKIQIGTYGSLKKGFHNHPRLGNKEYIGEDTIKGVMYLCYNYPNLYESSEDIKGLEKELEREHEIEIYKIDKEDFEMINRMEIYSGYIQKTISTKHGNTIIWINPKEFFKPGLKHLEAYTKETIK